MGLKAGEKAPDVTLPGHDNQMVALSSLWKDGPAVLLFFPLAFTSTCTQEMCSVRDDIGSYTGLQANVAAISVDSPFAQKQWQDKENLNFTLLSDFNREVCKTYGAYYDNFIGFQGVAKRAAFVIDKTGKVQYAEVLDNAGNLPNFDKIRETLQSLT